MKIVIYFEVYKYACMHDAWGYGTGAMVHARMYESVAHHKNVSFQLMYVYAWLPYESIN